MPLPPSHITFLKNILLTSQDTRIEPREAVVEKFLAQIVV